MNIDRVVKKGERLEIVRNKEDRVLFDVLQSMGVELERVSSRAVYSPKKSVHLIIEVKEL